MTSDGIRWPDKYHPDNAAIHVMNELEMSAAPEAVWACLIRATEWPNWYPNAANVILLDGGGADLAPGCRFRWKTFGVTITCTVEEFDPYERLAWSSESVGMSVYHAWLITPQGDGCHVRTEETQNGFLTRLAAFLFPGRMHAFHQIWLEELETVAGEQVS